MCSYLKFLVLISGVKIQTRGSQLFMKSLLLRSLIPFGIWYFQWSSNHRYKFFAKNKKDPLYLMICILIICPGVVYLLE